jgi:murein DD-endopeptidase MepM/ murein hydrolase activator NlpD
MKEDLSNVLAHARLYSSVLPGVSQRAVADSALRNQRVAEEFAALLLFEVMKAMRATLPEGSLLTSGSGAHGTYSSLVDTEVTRALAKRDDMGLKEFVARALENDLERVPQLEERHAPLEGVISSAFGLRRDPLVGDERFHAGVDIAAPLGTPVKAMAEGRVVFSGWAEGYGNLVTIEHENGLTTRYAHLGANLVSVGQRVVAGQEIALVGTSGRSTGPHLHFEVHRAGEPVDPLPFLSRIQA